MVPITNRLFLTTKKNSILEIGLSDNTNELSHIKYNTHIT